MPNLYAEISMGRIVTVWSLESEEFPKPYNKDGKVIRITAKQNKALQEADYDIHKIPTEALGDPEVDLLVSLPEFHQI